ncbi:MAG: biotin--[acetyl-CoA-carboxylase] ligase [Verrucomicrobiota bacterium]
MALDDFTAAAADFPEPFRLLVRESAESTNDEIHKLARAGAADGLIVLAERQTAGRGRRGAAWFSPPGESLAFSILVRPDEPKSHWPRLALATGVAVAEAIESFQLQPGIKWPNDVWIGGRKVAGILVEAGSDFAVVGVGLNVNSTEFPAEISKIATSLRQESLRELSRANVLASIIGRFALRRRQIGSDFPDIISAVAQRCVLTGHAVSLTTAAGRQTGIVDGIAPGGELQLRSESGIQLVVQADEIRLMES